jgi:hypothetical protein
MTTEKKARKADEPPSPLVVMARTPTMTNATSMHTPDLRAAFASVRMGELDGLAAASPTAAGRAWRSLVTAVRSA